MQHSYCTKYKFQVKGDQLSYSQIWGPFNAMMPNSAPLCQLYWLSLKKIYLQIVCSLNLTKPTAK